MLSGLNCDRCLYVSSCLLVLHFQTGRPIGDPSGVLVHVDHVVVSLTNLHRVSRAHHLHVVEVRRYLLARTYHDEVE